MRSVVILLLSWFAGPGSAVCLSAAGQEPDPAIAQLVKDLQHKDRDVRHQAAKRAAVLGPKALPAVPALVAALLEPEERPFCFEVSDALRKLGPHAVPSLTAALRDAKVGLRAASAWVLSEIGAASAPAVPALLQALKDESALVRAYAARALGGGRYVVISYSENFTLGNTVILSKMETRGGIGPPAVPAIPDLTAALGDSDSWVRGSVAQALAGFGSAARVAIPRLLETAKDRSDFPSAHAAATLVTLGETAEGLAILVGKLKYWSGDPSQVSRIRAGAAGILADLGPAARSAVPALKEALEQEIDGEVRQRLTEAMKKTQGR